MFAGAVERDIRAVCVLCYAASWATEGVILDTIQRSN